MRAGPGLQAFPAGLVAFLGGLSLNRIFGSKDSLPPLLRKSLKYETCSSPVTENVPLRRDRFIHRVPPSVTGLVRSWRMPLHPSSVNGPVHSPSIHLVNSPHTY